MREGSMGEGYYITLFSQSDVTAFHKINVHSFTVYVSGATCGEIKCLFSDVYCLNLHSLIKPLSPLSDL